MGRVYASMKEVSTDFSPIEPGVHRYEIKDVKEVKTDGPPERVEYRIQSEIVEAIEGDEKDVGRKFTDRIHIHMKTGELNEFGLAQLKRYFEVTLGEDAANDEDADTDWLVGQQFTGQTGIETYEVKDNLTNKKEERRKNSIERMAPIG